MYKMALLFELVADTSMNIQVKHLWLCFHVVLIVFKCFAAIEKLSYTVGGL